MTDQLTIICNNVPRDIVDGWELSPDERAQFDYINWQKIEAGEDSASFFRYKGELHDLGEFMATPGLPFYTDRNWHGYRADTFFSGVLVRYVDGFERIIVGRYYS